MDNFIPMMEKRPNILLIVTDQHRNGVFSRPGIVSTPAIDSLVASGIRFTRSYCASPLCCPSRSAMQTGRMPHVAGVVSNGMPLRASVPTMGPVMRAAGYETAFAGQWDLPEEYPLGKDAIPGYENLPLEGRLEDLKGYPIRIQGVDGFFEHNLGHYADKPVAEAAAKFVKRPHDKPFFLTVGLLNPHDICWFDQLWRAGEPPEDDAKLPPLPANHLPCTGEPEFTETARNKKTGDWDERTWRRYIFAYHRFLEMADGHVATVLNALKETGQDKNTIVIYTSDHGEGGASHRWTGKLMLHEEAVAVPFVISSPGQQGRVDSRQLASGLDIFPTICGLAGVVPPAGLEGKDYSPLLSGMEVAPRDYVVTALYDVRWGNNNPPPSGEGRMLRTDRYKYIAYAWGRDSEAFFDLVDDPGETRNLAKDPGSKTLVQKHRELLKAWIQKNDDTQAKGLPIPS